MSAPGGRVAVGPELVVTADAPAASDIALAASALARRFAAGGTLWCRSVDQPEHASHVAVEFLHPAVLWARALPAMAVDGGRPMAGALLTVDDALLELGAGTPHGPPPLLRIDAHDPMAWFDGRAAWTYHVLWELVHACLSHPPVHDGDAAGDGGAAEDPSGFLYPFLGDDELDHGQAGPEGRQLLELLVGEATGKAAEREALVDRTLGAAAPVLDALADEVAGRLGEGGRVLTVGNGGSAADAALFARLCGAPPEGPALAAHCLAADPVVATALANDLGAGEVFARQLVTTAGARDVVVAFSTSGSSPNVLRALAEARGRGALAAALVGDDGGAVAAEGAADHCVTVASDSVHRVQEAQAAAAAALRRRIVERLA